MLLPILFIFSSITLPPGLISKLCSNGIYIGGGPGHALGQRGDAPYTINPTRTINLFTKVDIGIHISMIELSYCVGFNGGYKTRDETYIRFDEWENLMGGGRVALRVPIIKNLVAGKIGTKYVWNHESCTQKDSQLTTIYKEEYNKWGLEPEVNVTFTIPKRLWYIDFLYEYQNLGRITIKEEISGNINYENLAISKYSIGFYTPIDFPNEKLPGGKERIPCGLVFSLVNKSDGRTDWFVGIGIKFFD